MKLIATLAALATLAAPEIVLAEIRVCETALRGPAGEHSIRVEVEDGQIIYGGATWSPPRQNARPNVEFPRLELVYAITDFDTGARSPLQYISITHAARMTQTRADTALVTISPYQQDGISRDWPFFARARNAEDRRFRNSDAIGGNVILASEEARQIALTAPQMESNVITNLGERLSSGVFLLIHRPALDALFDRAYQDIRSDLRNPSRECRTLRHDEWSRAQGPVQESISLH